MPRFCTLSLLVVTLILSISVGVQAQEKTSELEFGVSFSIPPWVMKDTNAGIELDLLNAAFADSPFKIKPVYVPFALAFDLFDAGKLDGVINAKPGVAKHGFLSEPVVTFQNVAISLANKGFPEDIDINFLSNKSVVAFQKARSLLGPEFEALADNNPAYQEIGKQQLQINLLFVRNVDFIVMDRSIFGYYWEQAIRNQALSNIHFNFDRNVRIHYIFPPSPYGFLFKDETLRDTFNKALRGMRDNGKYDEIINKYNHLIRLYERPSKGAH